MSDEAAREQDNWRTTILAGLANYIDAGSIVAGAAALALWQQEYALTNDFVGLIAAFGPNAIGAGVGALIGGWLCDRLGRKRIYQWDMLVYAAGMAMLVFAVAPWMIVTGFLIVGLAVGADIPASWSLIAEEAPDTRRGKHSGVAQVLWYLGPVVVLLLSLALTQLGVLGARIVFAHLLVIARGLTLLRSRMRENERAMLPVQMDTMDEMADAAGPRALLLPDGRRVLTLSADHALRLWDLERGVDAQVLVGHDGPVFGALMLRDGRRVRLPRAGFGLEA